jgi:hypothetical protein
MKKVSLVVTFFLLMAIQTLAQNNKLYISLGTGMSSFQDQKFSTQHHMGTAFSSTIGWNRSSNNFIHGFEIHAEAGREYYTTAKYASLRIRPQIKTWLLYRINENWSAGFTWNVLEFYYRNTEGLGNNATGIDFSSNLNLSGMYTTQLWAKKLDILAHVGCYAWNKRSTSFAFNAPQTVLEAGIFSFQDEDQLNPLASKGGEWANALEDVRLGTELRYEFLKWLTLKYKWEVRKYHVVEGYPTIKGLNMLSFQFNIINK